MVILPFSQIMSILPGACWQLQAHSDLPIPRDQEFKCLMFSSSMEIMGQAAAILTNDGHSVCLLVHSSHGTFGVTLPKVVFEKNPPTDTWCRPMIQAFIEAGNLCMSVERIVPRIKFFLTSPLE